MEDDWDDQQAMMLAMDELRRIIQAGLESQLSFVQEYMPRKPSRVVDFGRGYPPLGNVVVDK